MSDTQLVKDRLDIVDFIGQYVVLKSSGANHKGLCPFHREKSPSFMVSRERQMFKCFGCSKSGDIFSFLQEIEGLEFVEALKYLAERAGVTLTNSQSEVQGNQKNRLRDVLAAAAGFYHNFLLQMESAQSARDYLTGRGLKDITIAEWQIGFIPDQWDLLTQYLLKKGFGIDDLLAAGLVIKNETRQSHYDRFRGRIMFPIRDVNGVIVGFTGRVLVETEHSGGKYVNTPQTLLYDKSRVLFGLDKAKTEIRVKEYAVVVEGQMDVIACQQAGMKNVVAASGTALTAEQVTLLKRYGNTLKMAFDADAAGQAAAKRGIDAALLAGMNVLVISLPDGAGKDPDECLKNNPTIWFQSVESATDIMRWYFAKSFLNRSVNDPKHKQLIANELLREIALIPYAVERDHWLKELSSRLAVEIGVLREDMARLSTPMKTEIKNSDPILLVETPIQPLTRLQILLERYLALGVRFPILFSSSLKPTTTLEAAFGASIYSPLYLFLKARYTTNTSFSSSSVRDELSDPKFQAQFDVLTLKGELDFSDFTSKEAQKESEFLLSQISQEWKHKIRRELQQKLEEAERGGDKTLMDAILQELQTLI